MSNGEDANGKKKITTYAFIDAANVIYRYEKENDWKIDLKKLLRYLRERYSASKIFYYGGIDVQNEKQLHLNRKMNSWGYNMRLNPVKKFINAQGKVYVKADVDSRMTFDMMRLLPEYNRAVVLTGDGDFYWVLEYLLTQKEHIWLVASPRKTAWELKNLFRYQFTNLDDIRRWIEYPNNTK